jgi:putative phage-type endonuclease
MPYRRELAQGTTAWLAWRRGGIGASDAPVIMGVSPWMDLDTLWLDKTGQRAGSPSNHAMRRGQQLEPVARDLYVRTTRVRVEPICLEHGTHAWMRGSLDGLNADGSVVVEIKCPGERDHSVARHGQVPAKYVPQLQHLLAVSAARVCHYWSYRDGAGTLVEVEPDPGYIDELIARERDFWRHVVEGRRPQPTLFER